MEGRYKEFSQELFRENDKTARKFCKRYLPRILKSIDPEKYNKVDIRDNEDQFGPDLCCFIDNQLAGYFEPEIKHNWVNPIFPFNDLQIPERKEKWVDGHNGKPVSFCVLSKPCTGVAIVRGKDMVDSPKEEISNRYNEEGELFFKIPLNKVKFFDFLDYV